MRQLLLDAIGEAYRSVGSCARMLDMPRQQLWRYLDGTIEPKTTMVHRLADAIGQPDAMVAEMFLVYWETVRGTRGTGETDFSLRSK